jgi:hypothetical protein
MERKANRLGNGDKLADGSFKGFDWKHRLAVPGSV